MVTVTACRGHAKEYQLVDESIRCGGNARAVSVRALTRSFDDLTVIKNLDLDFEPGERVALHGPNGSGKTTLLRCIAGTLAVTEGRVSVLGEPAGSAAARRVTGFSLAQDRSFYLRLTGAANLLFAARVRLASRGRARNVIAHLVEELALTTIAGLRVDRCSTGMVQQLAFARALIGEPAVLLLDEPTRSLDEEARERLWTAIDNRPHCTVVIATHDSDAVARCTRSVEFGAGPA